MKVGIVGAGIFGIAAALELRARGHEVVVFEQGDVPNERASSTDVSKTIRRAYGDNGTYVDLVERAAPRWRAWQEQLGETFYWQIGQIQIERDLKPGHRVHDSYEYLSRRGREIRLLSIAEARTRFPQFTYGDGDTCVFDPWAGYVASGQAVAALARLARGVGITIRSNARVREVVERTGGVELALDDGTRQFDRAIVAIGVWLERLVPSLGAHLRPTYQEMVFLEPTDRQSFAPGPLPVWAINVEEEGWYGHPLGAQGWVKVANDLRNPIVDPD